LRIHSSLVRGCVLSAVTLAAYLFSQGPARAEITLLETSDGWSFFIDGRVNSFVSLGYGDAFPAPIGSEHDVLGVGSPFTAGFASREETADGKYSATRVRSGFLGTVFAFGMKRQLTQTTTVKSYMSLWGTSQSYARDRTQDFGDSVTKGFEVRDGWLAFDGPFGTFVAGRQGGILGGISTEIDFNYGHNFGLGLPCLDIYYAACGHIGTGALGPGNAAGFTYTTPSFSGFQLKAGIYDPVRLLGALERVPLPRPEATLSFARRFSPDFRIKLAVEGMYQKMALQGTNMGMDKVWGVAGGGRFEVGPLRLGLSAFHGKGLGLYVALQNSPATFNEASRHFRTFTGVYAQSALVFGREQISFGAGRVQIDLLNGTVDHPEDRQDPGHSIVKSQMGISGAFYHHVTENLVVGIDYFRFQTNWWGAPMSPTDTNPMPTALFPGEKQVVHFVNVGTTFYW